ncbi:ABC transporter permease [Aquamicrobium sp. NLF2-7]|jgi:peptide/nickel transport system permease protein|uniref:Peptide/nickel transport system permease protein n=1 Tax=Aquamicrobium lusatiense TaxID=89772 RepID=A0A7W9VUY8_9HYPH|nr:MULTISPECIES: ABC transporter permease [Aquamicrobium]MBB6011655.1 peptide/nickel transport system permease protein [Aquamicrobium lusatiense]MCG8272432.1 ABC transporter permease [Aquamicrobium sp. NLF2-7]
MKRFILKRIASAIPTLLIVSIVVFAIIRLTPGDPAELMLDQDATPEQIAELQVKMGLDKPVPVQYAIWLGNVLTGDFGTSTTTGEPVLSMIVSRFLISAPIVLIAIALATIIAVPLGMLAAWRQNKTEDIAVVSLMTLLMSIPGFWLGLIILMVFGLMLGWLPVVGFVSLRDDVPAALIYMIMPVATLVLTELGSLTRMTRASAISISRLEYITHARAKGLSEPQIIWRHALRNSFAPTWTLIGLSLGGLLGGIAITETVFTIPGLGRLLVDSIYGRDYPVVQGCILLIAFIYVIMNLVVDLVYPLLDPRVTAA